MGAWDRNYSVGMSGHNDPTGYAIAAIKHLLNEQGYNKGLHMRTQVFGEGMLNTVLYYQTRQGLAIDGVVGPLTMAKLLLRLKVTTETLFSIPVQFVRKMVDLESANDPGAFALHPDSVDRGLCQINSVQRPGVTDLEAYDPYYALNYLAKDLADAERHLDDWDAAVVSWNVGVGGAEAWLKAGKPLSLVVPWFPGDLGAQATEYLLLVQKQTA
jgi:hypothetical protein